jgi:cellulose biosynthesis protein BcsS
LTQKVYKNISIAGRLIPNFLTYDFHSGGNTVRAVSPGLYAVSGIKLSWSQTTFGLFGGIEFRNTNLNPDVNNAKVRGNTLAGLVQGELDSWLPTRTNFSAFASFSGTDSFLYQRARIKQQITNLDFKKSNTVNVGVEEIFGRNPEFNQIGGGLIVEIFNIPRWFSFAIRSGYKHDTTFGNGIYGGLEFYTRF